MTLLSTAGNSTSSQPTSIRIRRPTSHLTSSHILSLSLSFRHTPLAPTHPYQYPPHPISRRRLLVRSIVHSAHEAQLFNSIVLHPPYNPTINSSIHSSPFLR